MKRKIGIIIILALIAIACFFVGQHNVKRSLFSLSEDFNGQKTEVQKENVLYLPVGSDIEGSVNMGSSYVTLTFDYEWDLEDDQMLPEDANLQIDISCPEIPDNHLQWAFEPGKIEKKGSAAVDLKSFKGRKIQMKITCKGGGDGKMGVFLKNIYISKMYI